MRYYVQFMDLSVPGPWNNHTPELIDACGDTAIYILDGRNSMETMHHDALVKASCMEHYRKYAAYRIVKADGFNRPELASTTPRRIRYPIGPI